MTETRYRTAAPHPRSMMPAKGTTTRRPDHCLAGHEIYWDRNGWPWHASNDAEPQACTAGIAKCAHAEKTEEAAADASCASGSRIHVYCASWCGEHLSSRPLPLLVG